MQFFQVAAFCWSAIIAINLWFVIVRRRLDIDKLQPIYHIVVWSVVAICVIVPNFTKAYGTASVWCWINKQAKFGNVFRIITFFVPFYIAFLIIIISYIWISHIATRAYENMRDEEKERSQRQIARLRIYPIIFVILYIPATINRVYNWASQDDIFFLYLLQVLTAPAVGFVNSIAYGMDLEIRNRIANTFIRRGMCSYCLGDVILDESFGSGARTMSNNAIQSRNMSGSDVGVDQTHTDHYDEEDIIEGVLDERGGIRRIDIEKTSSFDSHVPLDPIHPSKSSPIRRTKQYSDDENDTVQVDF
jgi:hypothetical protein